MRRRELFLEAFRIAGSKTSGNYKLCAGIAPGDLAEQPAGVLVGFFGDGACVDDTHVRPLELLFERGAGSQHQALADLLGVVLIDPAPKGIEVELHLQAY